MPGVFVNRTVRGSANVSVRGLDESYGLTTINGRQLPAAYAPVGLIGDSRAFDYSSISPFIVNKVTVYKTNEASMSTGAIGATIDISTVSPMDALGWRHYWEVKGNYEDDGVNKNGVTPEASMLLSWSNDTFGILVSHADQERQLKIPFANIDDWRFRSGGDRVGEDAPPWSLIHKNPNITVVNLPEDAPFYALPNKLSYALEDFSSHRRNSFLKIEFNPGEKLKVAVDYTSFERQFEKIISAQSTGIEAEEGTYYFSDDIVKTPTVIVTDEAASNESEYLYATPSYLKLSSELHQNLTKTEMLGASVQFDSSEYLNLSVDVQKSKSRSEPPNIASLVSLKSEVATIKGQQTLDLSGDFPILNINNFIEYKPPHSTLTSASFRLSYPSSVFSSQEAELEQVRVNNNFAVKGLNTQVGWDYRNSVTRSDSMTDLQNFRSLDGTIMPEAVPDNLIPSLQYSDLYRDFDTGRLYQAGYRIDHKRTLSWMLENQFMERVPISPAAVGSGQYDINRKLQEEINALYIQIEKKRKGIWSS